MVYLLFSGHGIPRQDLLLLPLSISIPAARHGLLQLHVEVPQAALCVDAAGLTVQRPLLHVQGAGLRGATCMMRTLGAIG